MSIFRMNSNIGATKAYSALSNINNQLAKSQLRLATQKRINSVADDTSGFAVGKALDQKIQLMGAAQKNVGSAKDMLATTEAQLISVKDIVTSIRAKIADSSNAASDNSKISGDIKALTAELASIFTNTKFNDTKLLVSSSAMTSGTTFSFQTGADATDKLNINYMTNSSGSLSGANTVSTADFTLANVGAAVSDTLTQLGTVGTTAEAIGSLSAFLNTFENTVDGSLSSVGNFMQRLDIKDDFLTSAISNSQSSVSRLFDADMALEQLNATKFQIQQQVATSMFAQANQAPQGVLSLFR
jgi:flagellin